MVSGTAQSCYDPTNTQLLTTRTSAGETNGPTTSTVAGGVVTCSTTNANCGISLATGMGVCITASAPTAQVLYVGADSATATIAGMINSIKTCYVGTTTSAVSTSCGSTIASPYVATGACFVRKNKNLCYFIYIVPKLFNVV